MFKADGTTPAATEGGEGIVDGVSVWGDFEVHFDQVLGRGGMGSVYRARQRSLDRWVAIKVLDTSRAPDPELAEGFLEKFRIEALALARLRDPRIVTILQAGENEGRCWFAMELVEGRTVEQRLTEEGAFPEREAARVGMEVARALDAAFRQGIVHRDVKPANIFLGADGSVKLGDFGLARSPEFSRTRLTDANAVACTPAYASPEQAEGRPTDHRADIYSLGCVLYEMATERPPFMGDSQMETLYRHVSDAPTPPAVLNPRVSPRFERVILKCLDKDPGGRYQNYTDLIKDLESPPVAEPAPSRALPAAAAAGLALLGAILVAIYTGAAPSPSPEAVPETRQVMEAPAPLPPSPPALPVVQVPAPGDFPPSPPREEAAAPSPAPYAPAEEEVRSVEDILGFSRETLPERAGFRFGRALSGPRLRGALSPWAEAFLEADRRRVRAAAQAWAGRAPFVPGREAVLPLRNGRAARGTVVYETARGVTLELAGGAREEIPYESVSPAALGMASAMAAAGAGDASSVLAEFAALPEPDRARHAPGVVDQAIEEALRAADSGDFGALGRLKIPPELREPAAALLGARLRVFELEAEGAALLARKDSDGAALAALLRERSSTRAGVRAAAEILEEFLRSLPPGADHELVGEIPWGTWVPEGSARYDGAARSYLLSAAGALERAWLKRRFKGAKQGYRIAFRFGPGSDDRTVFAVALAFTRWLDVGRRSVTLFRAGKGGEVGAVRRAEWPGPIAGGAVAVVPRGPLVLVYLDERLLFALPEEDLGLEEGMQVGAGGGSVAVESIRVRDRNR